MPNLHSPKRKAVFCKSKCAVVPTVNNGYTQFIPRAHTITKLNTWRAISCRIACVWYEPADSLESIWLQSSVCKVLMCDCFVNDDQQFRQLLPNFVIAIINKQHNLQMDNFSGLHVTGYRGLGTPRCYRTTNPEERHSFVLQKTARHQCCQRSRSMSQPEDERLKRSSIPGQGEIRLSHGFTRLPDAPPFLAASSVRRFSLSSL